MSYFKTEKIKPVLEKLLSSPYDGEEAARALRKNVAAEVLGNGRVKIEFLNRAALVNAEVLIFVSKQGFVTDERGICKVAKLDYENYSHILFLDDDERYITACRGEIYAPVLKREDGEQ